MIAATTSLRADAQVIGLVGVIHGLSHFFQLAMAPLFPFMKDDLGVGYVQLGAVIAVFYAVSGFSQTLAGFVVDRFGARRILVTGLALYGVGLALLGMAPTYPWLFAGAVFAGLGNSVFHPGDFALLNAKVQEKRLGHAFSVHGIAGNIGYALAPMVTVSIALATSWRTALIACAGIALACAVIVALQRSLRTPPHASTRASGGARAGWRADVTLLSSPPVLLSFAFFLLYAMVLLAFHNFTTPTLTSHYGMQLGAATTALTAFLLGGAGGMLAGGVIATRTSRHGLVAAMSMLSGAVLALLMASGVVPGSLAIAGMGLLGFALGFLGPSRDLIIRDIAPADARGKVYGFVYSGLDLGGLFAPLAFGMALDADRPAWVFLGAAGLMLASMATILQVRRSERAPAAALGAP